MAQELVIPGPKDPEDREQDATLLLPLIGLSDRWRLTIHLEVGVTTILASPADAETIAWAALTEPPFFRGLPAPAEPYPSAYAMVRSAEAWLEGDRGDRELDRHDPYGSPGARSRSKPSEAIIAMMDLKALD